MSHNQVRLLFSDVDGHSVWFSFRNINKWIQKLWKPSIIGMYVGKYEGEWKDDQMHGKGTLKIFRIIRGSLGDYGLTSFGWKLIDQGKYVGEWKNGKEHGKGIRIFRAGLMNNDNGKYDGEWKNGLFHGKGTRIFPGGEKYEGEWKDGKRTGQGTFTWANGDKYEGGFKEGIPWNTTDFDKDQNFIGLHVKGVERNITPFKPTP